MYLPFGDYILVEIVKENIGGLVMPDGAKKDEQQKGKVVKVGEGTKDTRSGNRTEMNIKVGDVVVWIKYANADFSFEDNGKEYTLVKIQSIMGAQE